MRRYLIAAAAFIFSLPTFAQKAYEAVYYRGKTQNIGVRFTLGAGYLPACEIETTDLKTHKTSTFLPEIGVPDEKKQMKFYHFSASQKAFSDYFIIDGIEEGYDEVPAKLYGRYYFNGKAYPLTLKRK
ncbi:hypothetical protein [Taibaiella koreensis]|uniref:hypothetical protein n=1 Tax=Taibaiella koreensis TaxID=1268548 RepID=UPI000E59B4CD|nr:hypothetical protein [Taibaiella koreensis]